MLIIKILFAIVFLSAVLSVLFVFFYNQFQSAILRINEVENNIDDLLRNKFELLNRAGNIIEASTDLKETAFDDLEKLRSRKLSSFDLDQKLGELLNEFYKFREICPELRENESFIKINTSLEDIEEQIIACRSYYNDNIAVYNKLTKSIPSNVVGIVINAHEKPFFDGKDMYDNIYNDFKL